MIAPGVSPDSVADEAADGGGVGVVVGANKAGGGGVVCCGMGDKERVRPGLGTELPTVRLGLDPTTANAQVVP